MTSKGNDPVFLAEKINKSFGSTHANRDVSVSIAKGEVRGLIGENGSGKSTLISIISGMTGRDSGEMTSRGEPYDPRTPLDANRHKIGTVVQELGLVDGLPVGVNVFLGRMDPFTKRGIIDLGGLYRAAKEQFDKWGLGHFELQALAGTLSVEQKKVVELVRALSIDPDLLILDEITAALSLDNRKKLYKIIEKLKSEGKSVLIVTHDIEEMIRITDNITIMRDGAVVGTKASGDLTPDSLKRLMVGRDLSGSYYRSDSEERFEPEVGLSVKDLAADGCFEEVSFDLHKGEILGVCGLSDAGIHELGETVFGVRRPSRGSIRFSGGKCVDCAAHAIRAGIGYVPKDRDRQALMVSDSVENNLCLPSTGELQGPLGFISPAKRKELSLKAVRDFEIKTSGVAQYVRSLSGGNRQKVNLARWMTDKTKLLILDCPTRGVDVGVKSYIYHTMDEAKKRGISMIMISDELPELIGMSDTLLVMKEGKVVKSLKRSAGFTEESIIEVML